LIRLPDLPTGSYVANETRPLRGFRPAQPLVFVVGYNRDYVITIRNYPFPDYNIRKLDGHTDLPMEGVQFEVASFFANGSIGERLRNPLDGSFVWTTDQAGLIRIPNLPHGTFVATETRTLPGFRLHEPIIFVVDDYEPTTLTVRNYRYSDWNIRKLSGDTGEPLQNVVFEVAHFFGSGTTGERLRNALDGSIVLPTLIQFRFPPYPKLKGIHIRLGVFTFLSSVYAVCGVRYSLQVGAENPLHTPCSNNGNMFTFGQVWGTFLKLRRKIPHKHKRLVG